VATGDFEPLAAFFGRLADLRAVFFAVFTVFAAFLPVFLTAFFTCRFAGLRACFFPRFFAITIPLKSLTGLR
jgi:hypothetical protein